MKFIYFYLLVGVLVVISCNRNQVTIPNTTAWVPIYATTAEIGTIANLPPQPTTEAGKIYVYGNYIFQNDLYKGFHIIDNSNTANPIKIGFLKVPFSSEIAIKSNFLYTNNVSDLVVFDVSNISNATLVKRLPNAFPIIDQNYPPVSSGYFECVDKSKGIVVRWEQKQNSNANCRR